MKNTYQHIAWSRPKLRTLKNNNNVKKNSFLLKKPENYALHNFEISEGNGRHHLNSSVRLD